MSGIQRKADNRPGVREWMTEPLTRRQLVVRGGLAAAIGMATPILAACGGSSGGSTASAGTGAEGGAEGSDPVGSVTLNYFSWEPWAREEFLKPFEEEHDVTIKAAFYSSGEEMLTKLQAGGSEIYDMLSPVNNNIQQLVAAGLADPFDLAKLANWDQVIPAFQTYPDLRVDDQQYMIPFVWGTDTVAHNKKFIPEVNSWGVLFDPQYKGHLAVQDSAFETIALTAILLGYTDPSPFDLTDAQLEDCKKKLIEAKPLWRTLWTNFTDLQNLFISEEVWAAQGWLVIVEPIRQAGVDLGWSFVDEGSIGWIEGLSMVSGAEQADLIHEFADYCIGDEFMYLVYKATGYYPCTMAIKPRLTPEEVADSRLDDPSLPNQQHYYATPPNFPKWQQVWNEVKAA